MHKYLIIALSIFILTCESPERVWNNPNDSKGTLHPSEWSPTNLVMRRFSSNEISLSWEYDRENISGFKIDRKINANDWVVEYAVIEKDSRQWTDTDAIVSDSISYDYRLYAYAGIHSSAFETIVYNDIKPTSSTLMISLDNDSFKLSWTQNSDSTFLSYILYESQSEDMNSKTAIFNTGNNAETNYVVSAVMGESKYYQIITKNIFGLESSSNIIPLPMISFLKTFGGYHHDIGYSVLQTDDGGFVIGGQTYSFGNGDYDVWLIKTDSLGNEEWDKTFGGWDEDGCKSVIQTFDGGFLLTGYTKSFGSGSDDIWLIKTNSSGDEEWSQTHGGSGDELGYQVQQTDNGGYILVGSVDLTSNYDIWLINLDSQGDFIFGRTFGGGNNEYGRSVQQTDDGGYIIAGITSSDGTGQDAYLIKTNSSGHEEWNKTFGGSSSDDGESVQQTDDGGYIIAGTTSSFGNGSSDVWLIKTDNQGNEEWNKTFGGSSSDNGESVQQTDDGGYIIAGTILSSANGSMDVWLIKTDNQGNEEWNKTFGSWNSDNGYNVHDHCYSVQQTEDGGYIVTGGFDFDIVLIKTDSEGNVFGY